MAKSHDVGRNIPAQQHGPMPKDLERITAALLEIVERYYDGKSQPQLVMLDALAQVTASELAQYGGDPDARVFFEEMLNLALDELAKLAPHKTNPNNNVA